MIERRILERGGKQRPQYRASCDRHWRSTWVFGRRFAEAAEATHLMGCETASGPRLVGRYTPGTKAWHAARSGGLGGSEVSALFGLSRFESRFSLWHRKAGLLPEPVENDEMLAGTLLEPVIVRKFAADHLEWGVRPNAGTWTHRDRPWQIANPDGLLTLDGGELALLETKFSLYGDDFGDEGTDQIPPYYACQVQWYLDVFGMRTAYLMVFIGSSADFKTYRVEADPVRQAELREAAELFLASIAADERPAIDGHDATYETVRALHPGIDGGVVELPADLARDFCAAKHAAVAAAADAKRATAAVADFMGDAQAARFDGVVLARRQAKGDGVPYVVAARKLPVLEAAPDHLWKAS